eukprot:6907027-Prorocentrum_lima.AAC.1
MQTLRSWEMGFCSAANPRAVAMASNKQEFSSIPACLTCRRGPPVGRYPLGCLHRAEGRLPSTAAKRMSHISLNTMCSSQGSGSGYQ